MGDGKVKENHTNFLKGLFWRRGSSPVPGVILRGNMEAFLLDPTSLPMTEELHRLHEHGERPALFQGGPGGPGYMASGLGGSLKSLAADTSFLMCRSSVMPAS